MKNKRKPLVAGNWKMNKTPAEAKNFARLLKERVAAVEGVEILLCPPFISLPGVANELAGTRIGWGAQNMHWSPDGAYTGEISGPMLQAIGCRYVIVGHSERRSYFGESDLVIHEKLAAALGYGLRPIFCLGEGLSVREAGRAGDFCAWQLHAGLTGLGQIEPENLVIAYEPVWAIGTGKSATPADAVAVISRLRQELAALWGRECAEGTRILYGGSVKAENIPAFLGEEEIDGVLVGGASLNLDSFVSIINSTLEVRGLKA